jgi:serine/threonine protein kinase
MHEHVDKTFAMNSYCKMCEGISLESVGFKKTGQALGTGNFGTVWRGEDKRGFPVAIKELDKGRQGPGCNCEDYEHEARIMLMIQHENVVMLHAVFEDSQRFHMVLECCDGGDLSDLFMRRPSAVLQKRIANHMLMGIEAIHARQIIHRDIKPQNYLISNRQDGPVCKLCDFGFSEIANAGPLTMSVGTPAFMAPEQHNREEYHFPVDVWAAGIVLYMLLHAGKHPFLRGQTIDFVGIKKGKLEYANKIGMRNRLRSRVDFGKDLARKMLNSNPRLRPTASQAAQDAWFSMIEQSMMP